MWISLTSILSPLHLLSFENLRTNRSHFLCNSLLGTLVLRKPSFSLPCLNSNQIQFSLSLLEEHEEWPTLWVCVSCFLEKWCFSGSTVFRLLSVVQNGPEKITWLIRKVVLVDVHFTDYLPFCSCLTLSAWDLDIINFPKDLYFPLSFCRSFVLIPSRFHSPSVNFFHLQNWFKFFVLPSFSSLAHLVKTVLYSASILLMQTLNRMKSFCNKSFVWYLSELLSREFCPCHIMVFFLDCGFFGLWD